jgi:hypothetical protein
MLNGVMKDSVNDSRDGEKARSELTVESTLAPTLAPADLRSVVPLEMSEREGKLAFTEALALWRSPGGNRKY